MQQQYFHVLVLFTASMGAQAQVTTHSPTALARPAVLEDYITKINEQESEAMFCVVTRIDGQRVVNALSQTIAKSRGAGNRLYFYLTDRKLEPNSTQVELRCEYVYARPIDSLLKATPWLEGTLEFTPESGQEYQVRADFDGKEWAIWIRNTQSRQPVTKMIYGIPNK